MENVRVRMFLKTIARESSTLRLLRDDPERIKQKFGLNEEELEALKSADLLRAGELDNQGNNGGSRPRNAMPSRDALGALDASGTGTITPPATTTPPRTTQPVNRVDGVDAYWEDALPSWVDLKADKISFIILRSSEGQNSTDNAPAIPAASKYGTRHDAARAAGILVGAYHFYHAGRPAADQADNMVGTVKHLLPGDLPPCFDIEHHGTLDEVPVTQRGAVWLAPIQAFLDRIETRLGRTPMIYTSKVLWDDLKLNLPDFAVLKDYPLWVKQYPWLNPETAYAQRMTGQPSLPSTWAAWSIWQYIAADPPNIPHSTPAAFPKLKAANTKMDIDVFNGTIHQLRGLADLGRPAPHLVGNLHCIAYSDPDGAIRLLEFVSGSWRDQQVSGTTPALPPAAGDPAAVGSGNDQLIAYRATDDRIYILSRSVADPNAVWSLADTPGEAAAGDPVAIVLQDGVHIFYWDRLDNQVHLIRTGNVWHSETLNDPTAAGKASGSAAAYIHQTALCVISRFGLDGHLLELTAPSGSAAMQDLTAAAESAGSHPPAATYRPSAYAPPGEAARIVFRAVQGRIAQLNRDTLAIDNLTVLSGAPPCSGSPSAIFADTSRILFRAFDGTVYEIFDTGGAWTNRPVCASAASDPSAYVDELGHAAVSFRTLSGGIRVARFVNGAWKCEDAT